MWKLDEVKSSTLYITQRNVHRFAPLKTKPATPVASDTPLITKNGHTPRLCMGVDSCVYPLRLGNDKHRACHVPCWFVQAHTFSDTAHRNRTQHNNRVCTTAHIGTGRTSSAYTHRSERPELQALPLHCQHHKISGAGSLLEPPALSSAHAPPEAYLFAEPTAATGVAVLQGYDRRTAAAAPTAVAAAACTA